MLQNTINSGAIVDFTYIYVEQLGLTLGATTNKFDAYLNAH